MRMELEGKEPLVLLYGIPAVTAVIVLVSLYVGFRQGAQEGAGQGRGAVTIEAQLKVPEGGIRVENHMPPAQINIPEETLNKILGAKAAQPAIQVTPEVNARVVLPEGAIQITNRIEIPAARQGKAEVAQVPQAPPLPLPKAEIEPARISVAVTPEAGGGRERKAEKDAVAKPPVPAKKVAEKKTPVAAPGAGTTEAPAAEVEQDKDGSLLPPPRDVVGQGGQTN